MDASATEGAQPSPESAIGQEQQSTQPVQGEQPQQPQQDNFSRQFELLTKKERELFEQQRKVKSEAQKWAEREAKWGEYESYQELAKYDPIGLMNKFGWTPEKLAEHLTNNPIDPYASKYQKKLDEVDQWIKNKEEQEKNEKRRQTYHYQLQAIQQSLNSEPEKFELIHANKAYDLVLNTQAQYFEQYGERLSEVKAAELTESYLEKQLEPMLQLKKLKSKLGVSEKPAEPDELSDQQTPIIQQSRPSTLTNTFAPVNAPNSNKALSREESLKRAAQLVKWND